MAIALAVMATVAAAACDNASTLFMGDEANVAVAYDAACVDARRFRVRSLNAEDKYLNLSNLELVRVDSYPPVRQLDLAGNKLAAFQPAQQDAMMTELNLHTNVITELDALDLPPTLTKLDLGANAIASVGATFQWPSTLTWLALDGNKIASLAVRAFAALAALQYLSLSNVALGDVAYLSLPSTLHVLNLSKNVLTVDTLNITTRPIALQTLDLSENRLATFPDLSYLDELRDLNLAGNAIASISRVRLPPRLKTLNLLGNKITTFEVAASDFRILQQLDDLKLSTATLSTSCSHAEAEPKFLLGGATVCVLSDAYYDNGSEDSNGKVAPPSNDPLNNDSSVLDPATAAGASSTMSTKAMLLVGLGCFGMGLVVAVFVALLRREKNNRKQARRPVDFATFAPEYPHSRDHSRNHPLDRSYNEYEGSWVFESPVKGMSYHGGGGIPIGPHNVVAILEDDRRRRGRGRSKVEDLLVYEIPLDELVINDAIARRHQAGEAMYHAEYQGYQVVMYALLRSKLQRGKRRLEREFVEQARLASSLEHLCIVQFIGITFGTNSQSQKATHRWKMGVVFEYMQLGSLASLFALERTRREGKQYHRALSAASSPLAVGQAFSWFPSPPSTSITEDRKDGDAVTRVAAALNLCKLSIALDVAMALVYLHSMGHVHGNLHAGTVLLNEQSEAKLSAMDIDLAMNIPASSLARVDMRASAIKATMKVKTMFANTSISHSPALDSSLMDAHAHGGGTVQLSSMTASMLASGTTRARRRGMQGDVYSFGLLLWELDTMRRVDAMQQLTATTTENGEEHQMLRFSPECPSEVQYLARRCWHPDRKERATALDLQEDLVRLLEGRLTMLSDRTAAAAHRWSRRTRSSAALSSSFHSNHSGKNSSFSASTIVISETEV